MSKTHARFRPVQSGPSTYPTETRRTSKSCTTKASAQPCIQLEATLVVAEKVEVVARVAAAEARVLEVLLVLLLQVRLLVERVVEVRERVGEVMAREAAPGRWHCAWLSLERSRSNW